MVKIIRVTWDWLGSDGFITGCWRRYLISPIFLLWPVGRWEWGCDWFEGVKDGFVVGIVRDDASSLFLDEVTE